MTVTIRPAHADGHGTAVPNRVTQPLRSSYAPWQAFDLVQAAARSAALVHRSDLRKGTSIPHLAHLWSVAALVLEHGGDDVQVAAALLHDVAGDDGGRSRLAEVHTRFGPEVADLVEALSDRLADPTAGEGPAPWRARKAAYLTHLATAGPRVQLVAACDELHTARRLLADLREHGAQAWERLTEPDPDQQLWNHRSLATVLAAAPIPRPLTDELARTVDEIARLSATDHQG